MLIAWQNKFLAAGVTHTGAINVNKQWLTLSGAFTSTQPVHPVRLQPATDEVHRVDLIISAASSSDSM